MQIYLDWVRNQREDYRQVYSDHPNHSTVPWRSSTRLHTTGKGSATHDAHRPSDRRAHGPDSFDNAHISSFICSSLWDIDFMHFSKPFKRLPRLYHRVFHAV